MSKLNGNGHDRENDNVTSFEDARRRAAEKAKAKSASKSSSKTASAALGPFTLKQMLFGVLIVLMAIGYLVSLVMRATTAVNGGAA